MSKFRITSLFVCSALMISGCSYKTEQPVIEDINTVTKVEVKKQASVEVAPVVAAEEPIVIQVIDASASEVNTSGYYMDGPAVSGKVAGDYGSGSLIRNKIKGITKDYRLLTGDVSDIEREIKQSNMKITSATSDYVSLLAGMTVRLQAGTTPGNPRLVSQWNQSQRSLEDLSKELMTYKFWQMTLIMTLL